MGLIEPVTLIAILICSHLTVDSGEARNIQPWLKLLREGEAPWRWQAMSELEAFSADLHPKIAEAFLELLQDSDHHIATNAMVYLSKHKYEPKKVVPILASHLANDRTGGAAARTIREYGEGGHLARQGLLDALAKDGPRYTRREVIRTLAALYPNDRSLNPSLERAINDLDGLVRVEAARAYYQINKDERTAVETWRSELRNMDATVVYYALLYLGTLGPSAGEAMKDVRPLIKSSDADIRTTALETIVLISPTDLETWELIAYGVQDQKPYIRKQAINHLGRRGPAARKYLPVLEKATNDSDESVQIAARLAVYRVGGEIDELILDLARKVSARDPRVREFAIATAREIGAPVRRLIPLMKKQLAHENSAKLKGELQKLIEELEK